MTLQNKLFKSVIDDQRTLRRDGLFIASIDFLARHEGCLNAVKETQWAPIVVDEAHKLSTYEYGTKVERSDRYEAVEAWLPWRRSVLNARRQHLKSLVGNVFP